MAHETDVAVVGGGLAGAAVALHLARAGLSVVAIDRAEFPRDKPCGEGLLPHGVAILRRWGLASLLERCDAQPFRGIRYHCDGVTAVGDFAAGTCGFGVRRIALDDGLRAAAAEAGAMLLHANVDAISADAEPAEVRLADGRLIRAGFVIGADGPHSVVRRSLGLDGGPPRRGRYALRGHFQLAAGRPLPDRVEVYVLDGGELYVTPAGPGLIGVAGLLERAALRAGSGTRAMRLAAVIDRCRSLRERLAGATAVGPVLACGPLRVRARGVHRGRALLLGDAAGFVDAITGEGMTLSLRTAEIAADAVAAVLRDGRALDARMRRYARERAALVRAHEILTHALVWLTRHPRLARRAVARLADEPALFARLLAVNDGTRRLWSLPIGDLLKLAIGADPIAAGRHSVRPDAE